MFYVTGEMTTAFDDYMGRSLQTAGSGEGSKYLCKHILILVSF